MGRRRGSLEAEESFGAAHSFVTQSKYSFIFLLSSPADSRICRRQLSSVCVSPLGCLPSSSNEMIIFKRNPPRTSDPPTPFSPFPHSLFTFAFSLALLFFFFSPSPTSQRKRVISTFAGTFISADRENDTSRSALTNRPVLTYTHRTKTKKKWRIGKTRKMKKRGRD